MVRQQFSGGFGRPISFLGCHPGSARDHTRHRRTDQRFFLGQVRGVYHGVGK